MYKCKYCGKEFEKKQQLAGHIIWCKENPNRNGKSGFSKHKSTNTKQIRKIDTPNDNLFCKYCGKQYKTINGLKQHEIRCNNNPNKISFVETNLDYYNELKQHKIVKGENQYTKAKRLNLPKPIISDETRLKLSRVNKLKIWDSARRKAHSIRMREVIKEHYASYSSANVNGRVKIIEYNGVRLNGSWELLVAEYLDKNNIKWKRPDNGIEYIWNNNSHLYYPDFYLPDYQRYIEVKGYERDRDRCKYPVIKDLIIIKNHQIQEIKNNKYNIYEYL